MPQPTQDTHQLQPGTRVRHRRHHELTGRIDHIEYVEPGRPSAIPYTVRWDNDSRAADVLGWFFLYATDDRVEALPDEPAQ